MRALLTVTQLGREEFGPETVYLRCGYDDESLSSNDLKRILLKLSCRPLERRHRRKQQRLEGINAILAELPHPVPVNELMLMGNVGIGDAGMAHLHLVPDSVRTLNLARCGLTHEGIKVLCDYMKTNTSITSLLVWGDNIGDKGAKYVSEMLCVNKTFTELNLCLSEIESDGFAHLAGALAVNETLHTLMLHRNPQIQDDHIRNLFQGLKVNRRITTVNLGHGSLLNVTSEGIRFILNCLRSNHYLETLFNGISLSEIVHVDEDDPTWSEIEYLLALNERNRNVVADENTTLSDWLDCVIKSSQENDVGYSYFFLRSKPELCMCSQDATEY